MAFGIYKPGQGYWVRVLTAVFTGTLVAIAAAWMWNELEAAARFIPIRSYVVVPSQPVEVAAGTTLELFGPPKVAGEAPELLGTTVASGTADRGIRIQPPRLNAGVQLVQVTAIAPAGGERTPLRPGNTAERAFEPIFIQAGAAGLVLLIGAAVIYYFVGVKTASVEFLIATDAEMKKVNWSTRRDIINSTWVVILWAFLIAGGLFIVDSVFATFFTIIGVLEG